MRDIERGLLISEEILRHLVVVLAPRQRRAADETADGAAGEADDALAPPPEIDGTRRPSSHRRPAGPRTRPGPAPTICLMTMSLMMPGPMEPTTMHDLKAAEEVAG